MAWSPQARAASIAARRAKAKRRKGVSTGKGIGPALRAAGLPNTAKGRRRLRRFLASKGTTVSGKPLKRKGPPKKITVRKGVTKTRRKSTRRR